MMALRKEYGNRIQASGASSRRFSTRPLPTILAAAMGAIFLHPVCEAIIYLMLYSGLALDVLLFLRRLNQAYRLDEIKEQNQQET